MPVIHANKIRERGFTLVELLVVIGILGVLASIAIPFIGEWRDRGLAVKAAQNLKNFGQSFLAYSIVTGEFPLDTHITLPPEMIGYINEDAWNAKAPFGGNYNWEGPDGYSYAGVSLTDSDATPEQALLIDTRLDDGNLSTGTFRLMGNGRLTFIVWEAEQT